MVTLKVYQAKNIFEKIKGLVGQKNFEPLLIKTRFGIHTFGMVVPIDILILDKEKKVVKMKKNLLPNRLFLWNPQFDMVIELPEVTIEKLDIQKNTYIQVILC